MNFDEFLGQAKHQLEVSDGGRALRSVRAILTTLGERLTEGEAHDLAATLPMEIGRFAREVEHGQGFSFQEFLDRVAEREGTDPSRAYGHARALLVVLTDAVPEGEMEDIRRSLPKDFQKLFEDAEGQTDAERGRDE